MADENYVFIDRIKVLDRRAFGKLVMQWSRGEMPIPADLEEAEAQLKDIIQFPLPAYIERLNFIPTTKEVWTIKLPPADMLADTAARIAIGEPYRLSEGYRDRIIDHAMNDTEFFEFRVGDYTCSLCA